MADPLVEQMTARVRRLAKRLLPPVLVDVARGRHVAPPGYIWEGIYPHVRDVPTVDGTYDDARRIGEMTAQVSDGWSAVLAGQPVRMWHDLLALLAATVAAAGGRVRVLDFGGGVGTGFVQLASLPAASTLDYRVVELDGICKAGRKVFEGCSRIRFYTSLKEVPSGVDIAYVNSALQYVNDYAGTLRQLAVLNARYLLLARLAAGQIPTFASRQLNLAGQVLPYWFLNVDEVVEILRVAGYALAYMGLGEREYDQSNFPETHRIGRMRDLLFVRTQRRNGGTTA